MVDHYSFFCPGVQVTRATCAFIVDKMAAKG